MAALVAVPATTRSDAIAVVVTGGKEGAVAAMGVSEQKITIVVVILVVAQNSKERLRLGVGDDHGGGGGVGGEEGLSFFVLNSLWMFSII